MMRPLSAGALAAGVAGVALMLATPSHAFAPALLSHRMTNLRTCKAQSATRSPRGGGRVSWGIGALGMSGYGGKKGGGEGDDDLDWMKDMPTYGGGEGDGGGFQLPDSSKDQSRWERR